MGKRKRGRSVRNNTNVNSEPEDLVKAPHSFVIHKGLPGGHLLELTKDFRKVMEPFTASSLKERKNNTLKDFVSIAGLLHVSHLCVFSRTEIGMYFKIARLPRGPTLTFKVHNFSLARDVVSSLKRQLVVEEAFKHSPLIILNSFSGEGMQMKLMASMFQNMFPTINLTDVDLNKVRRCVLMNYNASTKLIDFRHYNIKVAPVGISKGVKKVVQGKVPNLAKCEDIADFISKSGLLSESEAEDDPNSHVTVPQKLISRGNIEQGKSAIRLSELGPRMSLQLIKIEDGLMDGEVLFHDLVQKTEEEKLEIKKKRELKKKLKEKRKKIQEANLKEKEAKKQELKDKALKGMKRGETQTDVMMKKATQEANSEVPAVEDDDAEYYRQEVGEEPDADLMTKTVSSKRPPKTFYGFKNLKPRVDKSGDTSKGTGGFKEGKSGKSFNETGRSFKEGKSGRGFKEGKSRSGFKEGRPGFKGSKGFKDSKEQKFKGGRISKEGRLGKGGRKSKVDKVNARNRDYRPIGGKGIAFRKKANRK